MRFLLDQSADARLLPFLQEQGHDATRIGSDYPPGLPDLEVLAIAIREQRVLITDDSDFGALVFHRRQPHMGVIYFRLGSDADLRLKIVRLGHVLAHHADELDQFLIVTRDRVRRRPNENDAGTAAPHASR